LFAWAFARFKLRGEINPDPPYAAQELRRTTTAAGETTARKGGGSSGSALEQRAVQMRSALTGKTVELRGEVVLCKDVPEIIVTSGTTTATPGHRSTAFARISLAASRE
jgi:hypothetical protein